ncbi:hypothetical protein SBBP2_890039 [Burkholderiales bacterium]|jgi:hypothetical protein|nr:hypothetical protein SBBP2_890039 [Burkholderiales bacterium]
MQNGPPGLGSEHTYEATCAFSAYVDPKARRIRLETKQADGSEVHLWLTASQFEQLLPILRLSARKLGIRWPEELPGQGTS